MIHSKHALWLQDKVTSHLGAIRRRIRAEREAAHAFSNPAFPPILIYQMGKVGSTTVYSSLLQAALPNPVLHLHFLSEDLPRHRETHENAGICPPPYHIFLGEAVRKALPKPCSVVSLVRDPIAFSVSDLYQNPAFARGGVLTGSGAIDPGKARRYLEQELSKPNTFSYVNEWFDRELKRVFDIDVFAQPFPVELGYAIYSQGNVRALVLRLEDLSQVGPTAISEFLDLEHPVALASANVRRESEQARAYRQILQTIALDKSVCRQIYSSRFVTHFYSEGMIDHFIARWSESMPKRPIGRQDR